MALVTTLGGTLALGVVARKKLAARAAPLLRVSAYIGIVGSIVWSVILVGYLIYLFNFAVLDL